MARDAFDRDQVSILFRERAQLSEALQLADQKSNALTQEYNQLIADSEQALTPGGRQRAQSKAERKGEELTAACARLAQLSDRLNDKEVEIADLLGALMAASQPLLAADILRQRLERIDDRITPVASAIEELRAAVQGQAELSASLLRELERQAGDPAARLPGDAGGLPGDEVPALPGRATVLLFASEPPGRERLDLAQEIREICLRIGEARFRDRITLLPWLASEPLDLIPNVNRHKPHMVQFSGRGNAAGHLMMGPPDRSEPFAAGPLIQMLKWAGGDLRIVFFNVCDSAEHARAAAGIVDAAIGLRGEMPDGAARQFAATLYSGLGLGDSLKHAFHQARAAIGDAPDSGIPQLFFRARSDPDKVALVRPPGGG